MSASTRQLPRDIRLHVLVMRCQTGDERAFDALLSEFGHRTLAYIRGFAGDDADDVQQELWLHVFQRISTLADPGAFRTWLFRATRNRVIDWLRRAKRERELLDDAPLRVESTDVATSNPMTDAGFIDPEELDAALGKIPPPQREVLLLRYRDDLSYADIALVVGCPLGTVRTRLHHGRKRLQELLKETDQ